MHDLSATKHEHSKEKVMAGIVDRLPLETSIQKVKKNINVEAAFLHILGDLLNSVGVIIAATIIFFWPNLDFIDPICTYIFAIIVLWTTR